MVSLAVRLSAYKTLPGDDDAADSNVGLVIQTTGNNRASLALVGVVVVAVVLRKDGRA